VFNLGRDESIEIGELARTVRDRLDSPSEIRTVSYREVFDTGFEDLQIRQPDLTRVRSAIDFEPRIELVRTIDDIASSLAAGGNGR